MTKHANPEWIRTIEVFSKKEDSYQSVKTKWEFKGHGTVLGKANSKRQAVKKAKAKAKSLASTYSHSVEVKIFNKDGSLGKQHTYKP